MRRSPHILAASSLAAERSLGAERLAARPLATRLLAVGTVLACLSCPSAASAQDIAGAVSAHFAASPQEDYGAALTADIHYPIEWFRIGGFFGVGAIPAGDDVRNRVFMPLGVSVGVELMGERAGFALRLRGGFWGGATQDVKLTAGGFLGGGAYFLIDLGAGVAVSLGLDVWGVFGDGETALFAPSLGLTWAPHSEPAPPLQPEPALESTTETALATEPAIEPAPAVEPAIEPAIEPAAAVEPARLTGPATELAPPPIEPAPAPPPAREPAAE